MKVIVLTVIWLALIVFVFVARPFDSSASDNLRYLKVKDPSVIDIPSQGMQCTVSKNAFRCTEVSKFPELTVFVTKKEFSVFKADWGGAQMENLLTVNR